MSIQYFLCRHRKLIFSKGNGGNHDLTELPNTVDKESFLDLQYTHIFIINLENFLNENYKICKGKLRAAEVLAEENLIARIVTLQFLPFMIY